jgi:WD40 repeat protein
MQQALRLAGVFPGRVKEVRSACQIESTERVKYGLARSCAIVAIWLLSIGAAPAQLRGHGGPVHALAISPDGKTAISGSFDTSAIRWSLERNAAEQVLRYHDGAVDAVAFLSGGRAATSGQDGKIAIWEPGEQTPRAVLQGHKAPVAALAVSRDGSKLASASWDHTARLWPLDGGAPQVLEGHTQNVNGIGFTPDGNAVVTAGYDATLRVWPLAGNHNPIIARMPTPLNTVAVAPDGDIVTAGADGKVYFLSKTGELRGQVEAGSTPVIAMAISRDGALIAAAGIRGSIAVIDRGARRRSGRAGVSRLRGLSHAAAGRRQPRRPDAGGSVRPPDRDPAGLQLFPRPQGARYRLDAGDGVEAVRARSCNIHSRHQDARAADRIARGARRSGEISGAGDQIATGSPHGAQRNAGVAVPDFA